MGNQRWQGNVSNAWAAGGNWIGDNPGVIPADGDTVSFLAADLGANACAVGPVAAVTLISITDDAGYAAAAGGNPSICYANITVTTVNCLSATVIAGGTIQSANLQGGAATCRVAGGTITTCVLGTSCRFDTGTVTTLNLEGTNSYAHGAVAANTVIGTANLTGTTSRLARCTFTTANLYGTGSYINSSAVGAVGSTVNVYGLSCEIAAAVISGGQIDNGPYVFYRDSILLDDTSGFVMLDSSWVPPYKAGAW